MRFLRPILSFVLLGTIFWGQAQGNPLERDLFSGQFANPSLRIRLEVDDSGLYSGAITSDETSFPLQARLRQDAQGVALLQGEFISQGQSFPFSARRQAEALIFVTGNSSYLLSAETSSEQLEAVALNPLDTFPFAGSFVNDRLRLVLNVEGDSYRGTLTVANEVFSLRANQVGNLLQGNFRRGGQEFDFQASIQGERLQLQSGSSLDILTRQQNPLEANLSDATDALFSDDVPDDTAGDITDDAPDGITDDASVDTSFDEATLDSTSADDSSLPDDADAVMPAAVEDSADADADAGEEVSVRLEASLETRPLSPAESADSLPETSLDTAAFAAMRQRQEDSPNLHSLAVPVQRYVGTLDTVVAGQSLPAVPIEVRLRAPLRNDEAREQNPFNLEISLPENYLFSNAAPSGSLSIASARGGQIISQYWTLSQEDSQLRGTLTTIDPELGVVARVFNNLAYRDGQAFRPTTRSYGLNQGTRLEGSLQGEALELRISGSFSEAQRPFEATIRASLED